ncbi:MAG: hypothetical protein LBE13_18935 [Bacteroidales bacterium]|nr:hypothetical protein [Bacteroidales bacterium]
MPDGEPINVDGKIDYSSNKPILEIKTSSIDILKYEDTGNGLSMLLDEDGYPIVVQPNKKRNE